MELGQNCNVHLIILQNFFKKIEIICTDQEHLTRVINKNTQFLKNTIKKGQEMVPWTVTIQIYLSATTAYK